MMKDFRALVDSHDESLGLLLVLSGFFGIVLGITTAAIQAPLEAAQVLMGAVTYERTSATYAMHISIFTLVNYLVWLFLAVTNSEIASSIILCALMGMIAMQCLTMIIFLGVRNVYLAVLSALPAVIIHLFGYGIAYPIIFMGSPHAYGRVGFFFVLFSVLFLAFGRFRTGFFFSGIALLVHPSWGLWLAVCLLLVLVTGYRYLKPLVNRSNLIAYFSGAGISVVALLLHRFFFPIQTDLPPAYAPVARELFLNYIRYWDYHRQRFDNPGSLIRELTYATVALVLSIFLFARRNSSIGERVFGHFMIVTTVLSVVFVFVPSWFAPDIFPGALIALMPGRFINVSLFVALPLLLGYVLRNRTTIWSLVSVAIYWAGAYVLVGYSPIHTRIGERELSLMLVAASVGIVSLRRRAFFDPIVERFERSRTNWLLASAAAAIVLLSPVYVVRQLPVIRKSFAHVTLPKPIHGRVLTTIDLYMLQAQARVPTMTPLLDGYAHSGAASLIWVDHVMSDIYGFPLSSSPPRAKHLHQGAILTADFQDLWKSRTCAEWERLAAAYNFDLIVVPVTLNLQLSPIDNDSEFNKYRPRCPTASTTN